MNLNNDNIAPFFQVVLLVTDIDKPLEPILIKFDENIEKVIKKSNRLIFGKDIKSTSENLIIRKYSLKSSPTWIISPEKLTQSEDAVEDENKTYEIFLLYKKGKYIFFHTSSHFLEDQLRETIVKDFIDIHLLDLTKIYALAMNDFLEFRTLGITNIFNAGGTAPEAKTLYGRNAEHSLTSSFDAGFGFSYGLGSKTDSKRKKSEPFGLSAKKRKIWRTWTENLIDFCKICDKLAVDIDKATKSKKLEILVSPIEISKVKNLKLLHCYIDYSIPKKGLLLVKFDSKEDYLLTWNSRLSEDTEPKMIIASDDGKFSTKITMNVSTKGNWTFEYDKSSRKTLFLIAEDGSDLEKRKGTDAIDYLNRQIDFTLIFESGIAYRDGVYWKDNRFKNLYKKSETLIKWKNVNIRKEIEKPKNKKHISITENVKKYLMKLKGLEKPYILIEDNGANEVSDLIALTDEKIILIHIKFSSSDTPGLRIEDLQVVCSQAVKNLRFLNPAIFQSRIERLKTKVFYPVKILPGIEQKIIERINNIQSQKECWIIQPGISKKTLENDTKNKAHSLLNYIEGICNSNNIKFRLFTSD
jgi:hypothetical protein